LNIDHARKEWREEYHELRPHNFLGQMTPIEFLRKYYEADALELIG